MRCSFLDKGTAFIVPYSGPDHPKKPPLAQILPTERNCVVSEDPSPSVKHDGTDHGIIDPYHVNMAHIKLFNNMVSDQFFADGTDVEEDIPTSIYFKHALTTPYLMHQCMAASALQLSIREKDLCEFYRDQSKGLQNRALALFNESHRVLEMTAANCVHMFLFSSLVGVSVMSDILLHQRNSIGDFIDAFTQGLSLYRGVLHIVQHGRELLDKSELGPHLEKSGALMREATTEMLECQAIRDFINASEVNLTLRNTYLEAIDHLQRAFNAQRKAGKNKSQVPLVLTWPMVISPAFIELMQLQNAEALMILAHYAIVLHRARFLWIVGDCGRFLITSISQRLGPEWQTHLEIPLSALSED